MTHLSRPWGNRSVIIANAPALTPFPGNPTDRMISRPDEPPDADSPSAEAPSKTRRKHAIHALQDLGEALVALDPKRLKALDLPERLVDAIVQARGITAHEGRRRQDERPPMATGLGQGRRDLPRRGLIRCGLKGDVDGIHRLAKSSP